LGKPTGLAAGFPPCIDKQDLSGFIVREKFQFRRSCPQSSLLRIVLRKLSDAYSIILTVKLALLMVISVPFAMVAILLSSDTRWFSSRPETLSRIMVSSEITRGLAFRLCGAIGVIISDLAVGVITGPPQLRE
jgi:hypothetical protein